MDAKKLERPFDEEEVLQELKKIWIGINCLGQTVLLLPFFKNVGGGKRGYHEGFSKFLWEPLWQQKNYPYEWNLKLGA